MQHEQAAAMMADAYARITNNYAATMVTSGPGATNLITGIACSYFDSIPNIHITGQVNLLDQRGGMPDTMGSRQIGFQETDIVSISKPVTKKSYQLKKDDNIYEVLESLYNYSMDGRKGPVLLDLPMCLQRNIVKKNNKVRKVRKVKKNKKSTSNKVIKTIINILQRSVRPVIIAGGGIRNSQSVDKFNNIIKKLNIPVVTTWSGMDVIDNNNPLYFGNIGVYGSRAANFCVQNADYILSLGSRLDTRITGGNPKTFARNAKLIMVDIDKGELDKKRGLNPYLKINADCSNFIDNLNKNISLCGPLNLNSWFNYNKNLKYKYPTVCKNFSSNNNFINPYLFVEELAHQLNRKDIIIPDDGGHLTWFMQAFKVKLGQRVFFCLWQFTNGIFISSCYRCIFSI